MTRRSKESPARARTPLVAGEPAESFVVVRGDRDEVVVEYRPELPAIRIAVRPRADDQGKRGPT